MTSAQLRYREYLQSPRWRLLRTIRRFIDGNLCRTCHAHTGLQVHHAEYGNRGGSFVGELRDTITLCDECHERLHRHRDIKDFA